MTTTKRDITWLAHMHTGICYKVCIKKGEENNIHGPVWLIQNMIGWARIGRSPMYKEEAVAYVMALQRVHDIEVGIEQTVRLENGYVSNKAPFHGIIGHTNG